ncbi:MAG TPA: MFS transporter [Sporomusa sp.]|nr:MFS transporter [Sporomusa sp.]
MVYLASVIVILNQFKVPPLMGVLMQQFQVNATVGGFLMSVFALTGIIMALPAAVLLSRFGPRSSGIVGLSCIFAGCIVGATTSTLFILMAGRIIEGVGLSLIAVIAPAVIAMYFRHDKLGLPMGVWATWYPVGSTIAYNISHPITEAFGNWRGSWWFGGILALIALVVYAIVVKKPSAGERYGRASNFTAATPYLAGLKTPQIWLLGFSFLFMMIGSLGFLTWAPTYFREAFGFSQITANSYASLGFLWSVPGGILAGFLLTKTRKQNSILIACAVLSALTYPIGFLVPQAVLVSYLAVIGFITGFTCALIFAMVPVVMGNRALTGLGMGVMAMMQSVANLVATPLFGYITADGRWSQAFLPTVSILIIGVIFTISLAKVKKTVQVR